jgi:hypothetical protein
MEYVQDTLGGKCTAAGTLERRRKEGYKYD